MTNKEVVEQGEFHGIDYDEYDSCSNHWLGHVYNVDGDLYLVEYCNGNLSEKDKPVKVKAVEVMKYEYEPI